MKTVNGGKEGEYGNNFMKIKFDTNANLLLNKALKLYILTAITKCVFKKDGKLHPQIYLDECLYEL